MQFSDYIVYADESGDHSLTKIDPQHPVFVLAFCVVRKATYINFIVPAFQRLKFDFWGHGGVVLHGHEIRKSKGDFGILLNDHTRSRFLERLNGGEKCFPKSRRASVCAETQRRPGIPNPLEVNVAVEAPFVNHRKGLNSLGRRQIAIAGAHIVAPGNDAAVTEVIAALRPMNAGR
jgi:hypothetical protein